MLKKIIAILLLASFPAVLAAQPETSSCNVKILPDALVRMGFTTKYPQGDFMDDLKEGSLSLSPDGSNLTGLFYLYHVSNEANYHITLQTTAFTTVNPISEDGTAPIAEPARIGYEMVIDSVKGVPSPAYVNGSQGIPAADGSFLIELGNTGETALLSNQTKTDGIWWRSLAVTVPLGQLSIEDIAKNRWQADLMITFTTE